MNIDPLRYLIRPALFIVLIAVLGKKSCWNEILILELECLSTIVHLYMFNKFINCAIMYITFFKKLLVVLLLPFNLICSFLTMEMDRYVGGEVFLAFKKKKTLRRVFKHCLVGNGPFIDY